MEIETIVPEAALIEHHATWKLFLRGSKLKPAALKAVWSVAVRFHTL